MIELTEAVLIYPASEAPNYTVGYKAAAVFCVASLFFTGLFKYQDRKLRRALHSQDQLAQEQDPRPATEDVDEKR